MKESKPFVIAVAGPTASGKSALAMELCRRHAGELVSCDSMQIYRHMDIGTAKPTVAERAEIPHHLIDICEPTEDFSAAAFAALAADVIRDITERGKLPVLCGGTGLYLDSVLRGIDSGEMEPDPVLRERLWKTAEEKGALFLHQMLQKADPEAAQSIHPNNIKRVVRALEICTLSGTTKTEWDKTALRKESPYRATVIALDYRNRDILYERIDNRVEKMLSDGLETEVRTLLSENALKPNTTATCAIGYKELIAYFNGDISLEQATENMKSATRHYAKRQLTWFRRNPDIRWLYPDDYPDAESLFEAADAVISKS